MQIGKWVPIDKRMTKFLPKTRKFTELEAVFSLSIDYDNQNDVTISGYSKLWGWSRTKVKTFLDQLGVDVIYPDDTQKTQKQKGQIKKQKEDRKETEKRQIRFIDSNWLAEPKNSKKAEKRQKKDRSKDTTSDPSLNPDPDPDPKPIKKGYSEEFENWWKIFKGNPTHGKGDKQKAFIEFKKIKPDQHQDLTTGTENYGKKTDGSYKAVNFLKQEIWKLHIVLQISQNNGGFKKKETKSLDQIIEERRKKLKPDFDFEIKAEA